MSSLRPIITLLFVACLNASGQRQEAPHLAASLQPDYPAVATMQKEPVPSTSLGERKVIVPLEKLKLSGNELAEFYHLYSGKRVIVSIAAGGAQFRCVFDATPKKPVTYDQAAELVRKVAELEGFQFVKDGEDPNLEVLTAASYHPILCGGVPVFNEGMELPENDDLVISYVMTLKHIVPAEAVRVFTKRIGDIGSYGSMAPVPNAAAVVLTTSVSKVRELIVLKKEIDIQT